MRNESGNTVTISAVNSKVYCGMKCGKSGYGHTPLDTCCNGYCGPTTGHQCKACFRLQNANDQDVLRMNRDGAPVHISYDNSHTKSYRHYCGRMVGKTRYPASDGSCCDGRCGPGNGCQCGACLLLDIDRYLVPSSLPRGSQGIPSPPTAAAPPLATGTNSSPAAALSPMPVGGTLQGELSDSPGPSASTGNYAPAPPQPVTLQFPPSNTNSVSSTSNLDPLEMPPMPPPALVPRPLPLPANPPMINQQEPQLAASSPVGALLESLGLSEQYRRMFADEEIHTVGDLALFSFETLRSIGVKAAHALRFIKAASQAAV